MKICTFNINGVRSHIHQIQALIEKHSPDVIGLQEIKCVDDAFPLKDVNALGYHVESFGQKGYYGVALLSKKEPVKVERGFPTDEEGAQRRMITGTYLDENNKPVTVMNGYFPQGESRDHEVKFPAKMKFYADLLNDLKTNRSSDEPLIIMGDMNIAPTDLDIGIGEKNAKRWLRTGKCSFLPEEREVFKKLIDWGLTDLFDSLYPDRKAEYSWFDYRSGGYDDNRGLRIDVILGTEPVKSRCSKIIIDREIRGMTKPSDHCPMICYI